MPFKILHLGNNESIREIASSLAEVALLTATNESEALELLRGELPQAVLVDFDATEVQALAFAKTVLEERREVALLGVTQRGSLRQALNAVAAGFQNVIHLTQEPGKLHSELAKLIERWREREKAASLHAQQRATHDFGNIIGNSPAMQEMLEVLGKIIQRKGVTVLLRGETGTGKELIARTIHYNSSLPTQPFVEINCSAIPENLLEAELFGYEKGAFTDAKIRKKGLFELAENGTLFLDEIGDISLQVQVKLLKAVEEKKIRRLGGVEDLQINTRIIAATNRDLQVAIREGQFRQDLYYRLNVITLLLPPLRERGGDMLALARHFLSHYAKEYASTLSAFTLEAEALLREYTWPGNIRELQHTIERIVLLGEGQFITRTALERAIASETPALTSKSVETTTIKIDIPPEGVSFEDIEKQALQAVLEQMGWNKRRTSRVFKISRPRLARKIEKYQLKPPSGVEDDEA